MLRIHKKDNRTIITERRTDCLVLVSTLQCSQSCFLPIELFSLMYFRIKLRRRSPVSAPTVMDSLTMNIPSTMPATAYAQ
uniref:Uncharacterized protein n=1 Tax=Arundo donax TaxID=35708 RepID=A0A0A9EEU7_ARUDO